MNEWMNVSMQLIILIEDEFVTLRQWLLSLLIFYFYFYLLLILLFYVFNFVINFMLGMFKE